MVIIFAVMVLLLIPVFFYYYVKLCCEFIFDDRGGPLKVIVLPGLFAYWILDKILWGYIHVDQFLQPFVVKSIVNIVLTKRALVEYLRS